MRPFTARLFAAPLFAAAAAALIAAPALARLTVGEKAPDFTTRGAIAGQVVNVHLSELLKKGPVVLYFFPAAFTGGCNAEAHAFAEAIPQFTKAGATVLGMSADPIDPLVKFSSEKCAGKFAVASAGPAVIKEYDVAYPKEVMGHTVTTRTSYVIAPDGKIVFVHDDMNPADHVTLTLAAVEKMTGR